MPETQLNVRIAFVGGGNMARSLIGGLVRQGMAPSLIAVAEPNAELREALSRDFGVGVHAEGAAAAAGAAVILLAVKPQVMRTVCESLQPAVQAQAPLLISIAAGIRIDQLEHWCGGSVAVVRSMPNTPALVGAGASGLCANAQVSAVQRGQAETILGAAGLAVWIDEEAQMDVVTALSGSGPAYFFLLVEALEDAAVAQGLPRDAARALATQTALGAGRMLREDGEAPAVLRQRVTSPGGTTQAALDSFAASGLRETVARAVAAATERGRELAAKSEG
ncbi:pyrroline-5-carboxylate reductase [Tahibacter aquaticus]|uniref:Pyrroline-5-carboxylate reductase n=1 Tax=Tahibacter aquaticus TaxID=520092 RepID=A0A4R6YTR9_9GAMM|nr:pyrroline-5-carboxylate reductase [Tahibacter aquaticus]TDR41635.1 pyrroline-5-carboxylate reductase [Tahibacter aquaticus]